MPRARTTPEDRLLSTDELTRLRRNLRRWHRSHGRNLPWRQVGDPYRVWMSEIMLQQTTVAAVVPYYERFLARFPNVESLAEADEQDVLRLWEGLGYYRRARNLHKASRCLVAEHGGRFPMTVDELRKLPGIGRYTAGAIASFAFDRPAPIVEANTLRLYCRLLGFDGDPRQSEGQRLLWSFAEQLVPANHAGEFNQALIDLGALVCTVNEPGCPRCPLKSVCRALAADRVAPIPRPASRAAVTEIAEASVAIEKRGEFLLRRRGDEERWAGLWDLLRFDLPDDAAHAGSLSVAVRKKLVSQIYELTGIEVQLPEADHILKHSVTRYRITLHCLRAEYQSGRLRRDGPSMKWVRPADFDRYPLSVTGRKFARLLSRPS